VLSSLASQLPQFELGAFRQRIVGFQNAFASKLAPTVGLRTSAKTWSAVRPPSRAGSLRQLDCVHLQKTGQLSGRLREQAHSYSWIAYICKKQVSCQAAFASRLTPTVGLRTSAKNRSAVRPPSRAGSLPQLDCVHLQKTGRLSGRLREQARSHSWIAYICKKQVGCQAAFASKLAPTVGLRTSAKNRSAVRPPSRASSLPQLDCVHLQKTGRLSGRHRERARSHRKARADRFCSSPLNRMSVSSAAAFDLDLKARRQAEWRD
jgi:hypothetical protein